MRILHFSDFHLSKLGYKESCILIDRLIDCIKPLNSQKKFDLILFTGDMVDQGGKSFGNPKVAYGAFRTEVIDRLCKELNIPRSAFYVCPGNHEVNRNLTDKKKDYELERRLSSRTGLNNFLISDENPGFDERLKDYDRYFRQDWLKDASPIHETAVKLADHFVVEVEGRKVGISCLNSAWRCGKKIELKTTVVKKSWFQRFRNRLKGKPGDEIREEYVEVTDNSENSTLIGETQVTDAVSFFRRQDVDLPIKIALAHHHFSMLGHEDSDSMDSVLRQHYDLCFFGHTHSVKGDKHSNHLGEMVCTVAPGVIKWNAQEEGKYRNGFSVWDIDFSRNIAYQQVYIQKYGTDFDLDREFGQFGCYPWVLGKESVVIPLKDFIPRLKISARLDSEELSDLRKRIVESDNDLILYGVPGVGKTYMLATAFEGSDKNVLYCGLGEALGQIHDRLKQLFDNEEVENTVLIFDNCTIHSLNKVLDMRDSSHSCIRIIGATNVYSELDKGKLKFNTLPIEELTPELAKSAISAYVDERVSDYRLRETIKQYADGFPQIAIKLVEQILRGAGEVHGDPNMMRKLIESFGNVVEDSDDLLELLQVMSLFQPFPKLEEDSMAIWRLKSLSSLHDKTREEIVALIEVAKKIWHGSLLESSLSGYSVRPFILAVCLAEQWIENHRGNDDFENLLIDIGNLPDAIKSPVMASLTARLQHLGESEGAKKLFKKLTDKNGFFRSENVVVSELGSRLILAISDVNPQELASALKSVFTNISQEGIGKISWSSRRNLVSALTRLAYYKEGFDDALTSLAILAAFETEENLANNATGTLRQLFHILLSGTQAPLDQRMRWLENTLMGNDLIKPLLPTAIQGVFAAGSFMRMGGLGPENKETTDYNPTFAEIKDYWSRGSVLVSADLDAGNNIDQYTSIIINDIQQWSFRGMLPWAMPFVSAVAHKGNGSLKILEWDFERIVRDLKKQNNSETLTQFDSLRPLIVASDVVSRLKSKQNEYYGQKKGKFGDYDERQEIEFFIPVAEEFIKSGDFSDRAIWDKLLDSKEILFWPFCVALNETISDAQLNELYNAVLESNAMSSSLVSPFLFTFCSMSRNRKETIQFIENVFGKGYCELYTRLMARTEDENFSSLNALDSRLGKSGFGYLPIYLENASLTADSQDRLLNILVSRTDEAKAEIIQYVVTHYQYVNLSGDGISNCKTILLTLEPADFFHLILFEYVSLCINLLKTSRDEDFARAVIAKLLSAPHQVYDSSTYITLFRFMLEEYRDLTIPMLLEAFADSDILSIGERLARDLGSGMGFGYGDFFKIDKSQLLSLLNNRGLPMARVFAKMCPVFESEGLDADRFSDWTIYLLDHYGEDSEVRSNLSANMGSYMWSGSIVPLLEKKIRCFKPLLTHSKKEVCGWAESNLQQLEEEQRRALINEDFMEKLR